MYILVSLGMTISVTDKTEWRLAACMQSSVVMHLLTIGCFPNSEF